MYVCIWVCIYADYVRLYVCLCRPIIIVTYMYAL